MAVYQVLRREELPEGTMRKVVAGGKEILLARVEDSYYAVENKCPHLGGDLSRGTLEGEAVTCPLHGSQFNLTNGKVIRWTRWTGLAAKLNRRVRTPRSLNVYRIITEDNAISVDV